MITQEQLKILFFYKDGQHNKSHYFGSFSCLDNASNVAKNARQKLHEVFSNG